LKDAAMYPDGAGHYKIPSLGRDIHYAYLVLGRAEGKVLVLEGNAANKMAAIDHLVRMCSLLKDGMDIAFHGAFWAVMEEEQDKRNAAFREQLGLTAVTDALTPKKDVKEPS
jgi:hypothetical protein